MAPAKPDPAIARSQFKEDMIRVMGSRRARQCGWKFRPDYQALSLRVAMWSLDKNCGRHDDYHIAMDMSYYRDWPPGVTFVNPDTGSFDPCRDARWLPANPAANPPGVNIGYHLSYTLTSGETKQMVCNSMVLEYYMSNHTPRPEEAWDPRRHTLYATLTVLQDLLREPYYGGRRSQ